MAKKITIYCDDCHTIEDTVEEVAKQIDKGYTSGIDPTFKIEEVEE